MQTQRIAQRIAQKQCEESETHDQVLVMTHEVEDCPLKCTDDTAVMSMVK